MKRINDKVNIWTTKVWEHACEIKRQEIKAIRAGEDPSYIWQDYVSRTDWMLRPTEEVTWELAHGCGPRGMRELLNQVLENPMVKDGLTDMLVGINVLFVQQVQIYLKEMKK